MFQLLKVKGFIYHSQPLIINLWYISKLLSGQANQECTGSCVTSFSLLLMIMCCNRYLPSDLVRLNFSWQCWTMNSFILGYEYVHFEMFLLLWTVHMQIFCTAVLILLWWHMFIVIRRTYKPGICDGNSTAPPCTG